MLGSVLRFFAGSLKNNERKVRKRSDAYKKGKEIEKIFPRRVSSLRCDLARNHKINEAMFFVLYF
jgi:hypothetical protein